MEIVSDTQTIDLKVDEEGIKSTVSESSDPEVFSLTEDAAGEMSNRRRVSKWFFDPFFPEDTCRSHIDLESVLFEDEK